MTEIERLEKENQLLRERLEIVREFNKLIENNKSLRLPNRITPDTWDLMSSGRGGCISFS